MSNYSKVVELCSLVTLFLIGFSVPLSASAQLVGHQKISASEGLLVDFLDDGDAFGASIANLGDVDGDGIHDIAVGASRDDDSGQDRGALWILFLDEDGVVSRRQKISSSNGGFTGELADHGGFGIAVTCLDDLNGDGVPDVAVGMLRDNDGGSARGAVWILFLERDGTVKREQKISSTSGGFIGTLSNGDFFGRSLSSMGDLNGDGINDLAVGAYQDDDGGANRGAVWILFLEVDGTVKGYRKISGTSGGFNGILKDNDFFGISVAPVNDIDGDGVRDLVVGADFDDDGGLDRGAVWVLFLNENSTVKGEQKISSTSGGFAGELTDSDLFGISVISPGDINLDGIPDLVVGAIRDDDGKNRNGDGRGAVWILFLKQDGSVQGHQKISDTSGDFSGSLDDIDRFSISIASLGDIDNNGIPDIAVGAYLDDDGGIDRGAVWMLLLEENGVVRDQQKISSILGEFNGNLNEKDFFGAALTSFEDLDGDGVREIGVGAPGSDDGGLDRGAVWLLFLDANGKVRRYQKISDAVGGFNGDLDIMDRFGASMASLGDIDGDGIHDLAVGASGDDDGGENSGAIWILFLEDNERVKDFRKLSADTNELAGELTMDDRFGISSAPLGDLNGDGTNDLVVGAAGDDDGGIDRGALWLLFLQPDGSVKLYQKISMTSGAFKGELADGDSLGISVTSLGDINGDGFQDLAVGASGDNDGGEDRGAVWIMFLNADGKVKDQRKISSTSFDFEGNLDNGDRFGSSVTLLNDIDGNGINDLVVGAPGDDDGGLDRGALWIMYMEADGSIKEYQKISRITGRFTGDLDDKDSFGASTSLYNDLNGDTIPELIVGATGDDDGGLDYGAVWVLFLNSLPLFEAPVFPVTVSSNEEVAVAVEVLDTHGLKEIRIEYGRGGDPRSSFSSRVMIESTADSYEGTIPEGLVTDRGLQFFFTAEDSLGLVSREPETGVYELRVETKDKQMTNPFPVDSYKLFSVPLELKDNSISAILEDDLGSYDPTKWRFFEPIPMLAPSAFPENSGAMRLKLGKAYWLITEETNAIIDTGTGISTPTVAPFSIPLEPGWNYIGTPFTFTVPVTNLYLKSGGILNICTYEGGAWQGVESIKPFEGYIVSSSSSPDTLFIDAAKKDAPVSLIKCLEDIHDEGDAAKISIVAESGEVRDWGAVALFEKKSGNGWDRFDSPAPPQRFGDYISAYFLHPEWNKNFARYSVDARPPTQKGEVWDFEVASNIRDVITLTFNDIGTVPADYDVWLIDDAASFSQNLREVNTYSVAGPLERHPKQLKLVVGKSGYIEEQGVISAELPNDFQLSQNFPNPFSFTTTIPYALPKPAPVTLAVYSILGKRVTSILQGEEKPAGYHAAIWDGRNDAGQSVASGLYFIKMEAGTFTQTRKTTVVR